MSVDAIKNIQVLRNLRDGDVLWVQVQKEAHPDEVQAVHTALEATISPDVVIIVSHEELVRGVEVMPLSEIVSLRDRLDHIIRLRASEATAEG